MTLCIWKTRTLHSARSGHASTAERESWSHVLVSAPPEKPRTLFESEVERRSMLRLEAGTLEAGRVLGGKEARLGGRGLKKQKGQGRGAQTVRECRPVRARCETLGRQRRWPSTTARSAQLVGGVWFEARRGNQNQVIRRIRPYTANQLRVIPGAGVAVPIQTDDSIISHTSLALESKPPSSLYISISHYLSIHYISNHNISHILNLRLSSLILVHVYN